VCNSKGHEATGTKTSLVEERFENGVVDDNKRTASEPASQPAVPQPKHRQHPHLRHQAHANTNNRADGPPLFQTITPQSHMS
jgi:hypothetical protein